MIATERAEKRIDQAYAPRAFPLPGTLLYDFMTSLSNRLAAILVATSVLPSEVT